jgi:steroid delta-isomerase-like uncharacterized protein
MSSTTAISRRRESIFTKTSSSRLHFPVKEPGLSGLKDVLRGFRAAFPDIRWSVEEQIEEGDKVVSRFVWSGTHRAEFLGVPASERPVSVWGIAIDRIVDGKIKESRIIMDTVGLMAQMNVRPPRAS